MENDETEVPQLEENDEALEAVELETKDEGEDYRAKLNAQNRFLEKEGYTFKDGKWLAPVKQKTAVPFNDNELSTRDMAFLLQNNVPAEDFDEVMQAAKLLNKPISEALKSGVVRAILAERIEERRTANATQTSAPARGTKKVTGDDLLARIDRTGELPETDEEMNELARARLFRHKKTAQR